MLKKLTCLALAALLPTFSASADEWSCGEPRYDKLRRAHFQDFTMTAEAVGDYRLSVFLARGTNDETIMALSLWNAKGRMEKFDCGETCEFPIRFGDRKISAIRGAPKERHSTLKIHDSGSVAPLFLAAKEVIIEVDLPDDPSVQFQFNVPPLKCTPQPKSKPQSDTTP